MTIQVSDGQLRDRLTSTDGDAQFIAPILQQRTDLDAKALGTELYQTLTQLRESSSDRLKFLQLPSTKDEEWKFTDPSPLWQHTFRVPQPQDSSLDALAGSAATELVSHLLSEASRGAAIFIDGIYAPQKSTAVHLPNGAIAGSLAQFAAHKELASLVRTHLAKHPDLQDIFATLNAACLYDVAVVYVPQGVVVSDPVQLVFASGGLPAISQPRCLVIAETDSSLSFVETYIGTDATPYFTNAVTEIWVGENARVNHTKVQWEGNEAFHIATSAIAQSRHSHYTGHAITLGAQLSRHNWHVRQMREGTETHLNGLTLIACDKLADTHSCIAHDFPYGSSRQINKCIVDDRAHAVFNGKIQVAKAAQLTDSSQLSRNLLLSSKARVDTKPQLEIFADNVKCAHGATVSQLDAEEIFYLQSRGIDAASAANLLAYAFAAEVIGQIPVAALREQLNKFVLTKTQELIC